MSYIVREGNLAGAPELKTSERTGKTYARVGVIANDSQFDREAKTYTETGSERYQVTVFGSAAVQLEALQAESGNVRVVFGGTLTVRDFTRDDGTEGVSHDVAADFIGASLSGQRVTVEKTKGGLTADERSKGGAAASRSDAE